MHACMDTYIYPHKSVHSFMYTYIRVYIPINKHIYTVMYMYLITYIHTYIHTYIYKYIHIHFFDKDILIDSTFVHRTLSLGFKTPPRLYLNDVSVSLCPFGLKCGQK